MVRGNRFLGGLGERFGLAQIQTRKVELFEANHDLGHQKFATYALNHLLEVVAPRLRVDDMQSRGRKPLSVALEGLGVPDAGNPREQSLQRRKGRAVFGDVADPDPSSWFEDALKLVSRCLFAGKGAEGAFAEDGIERGGTEGQRFGISKAKLHQAAETACCGRSARIEDVLIAEVYTDHAAPKLLCEKERGRSLSRGNIEDDGGRTQRQQRCQLLREAQSSWMKAFTEEIFGRVTAVHVGAALLDACGVVSDGLTHWRTPPR